ncbi:MAG: hypothetical protein ACRBFS_15570 [Aureispira sp.]
MIRYNKKELSKEIKTLLKANSSIYGQAMALEEYIKQEKLKEGNTFLLMASLEWKCGQATKFPEDIISFGTNALEWLAKALKSDIKEQAVREKIATYKTKIERAKKKAQKSEAAIFKAENQALPLLKADPFLSEIAFYYYSKSYRSTEDAEKGYLYYSYLYEREEAKDNQAESLLYYWDALTYCKFLSRGFLGTQAEIQQLQDWVLAPRQHVYTHAISHGFWYQLYYYSRIDDLESFRESFLNWASKMKRIAPTDRFVYYKAELVVPVCAWLLEKQAIEDMLSLIFQKCSDVFVTTEEKEILQKMEIRLNTSLD